MIRNTSTRLNGLKQTEISIQEQVSYTYNYMGVLMVIIVLWIKEEKADVQVIYKGNQTIKQCTALGNNVQLCHRSFYTQWLKIKENEILQSKLRIVREKGREREIGWLMNRDRLKWEWNDEFNGDDYDEDDNDGVGSWFFVIVMFPFINRKSFINSYINSSQ